MISEQLAKNTGDLEAFVRDTLAPQAAQAGGVDPGVALLATDLADYVGSNASGMEDTINARCLCGV